MWTDRRSGFVKQRGAQDHRDPYEKDSTRVIHCPSFRRLARKTQILGTEKGDFHRTRLTHSLEVASIGRSIVRNLKSKEQDPSIDKLLPNDDLITVVCLLHDIGHPPFGHGGETALNFMMRAYGGFESNAQSLRLLTKLESCYGNYGLDLTRRSLLGVLKYPASYLSVVAKEPLVAKDELRINDWLPPKAYFDCEQEEISWLLTPFETQDRELFQSLSKQPSAKEHGKTAYHSFDCSIMDIADNIAYGVHDLEDAIHLNLISRELLDNNDFQHYLRDSRLGQEEPLLIDDLFSKKLCLRKHAIGQMVNYFISATTLKESSSSFNNSLLKYNISLIEEAELFLDYLIRFIYDEVINSQDARVVEYAGQTIILRLFEALRSNPEHLLDSQNRRLFQDAKTESEAQRVICDYIANMTDENASSMHEKLFGFSRRLTI